ncbi:Phosphatase 2C like protein [Termitomyces sp. J132]|nr:Phosphatase 2C like protein [Termitomyces sp. J132]
MLPCCLDDGKEVSNTFFAIYDGQNGSHVAQYTEENVHKHLVEEESYKHGRYELTMKRALLRTDKDLFPLAKSAQRCQLTGRTAIAANAGDSRSVIGVSGKVKSLSYDHKTNLFQSERARIYAAGGYLEDGRVNGNLLLSRAIGDFIYKKNSGLDAEEQIITANLDVIVHEISEEDEFFVIACDGIWDCLSSREVIDFVRHEASLGKELAEISENICDCRFAPEAR